MAQAYKHMIIGSTVQIAHYIGARMTELNELIERSKNETRMWESLKGRPELPSSVTSFLSRRIDKLAERSRSDQGEAEMLNELRFFLKLCDECKGHGCTTCDGRGEKI